VTGLLGRSLRTIHLWSAKAWHLPHGRGTGWDSLAFDPELDLLYVGVGNGSPWSRQTRSPGGGDNLYLASILALRPDNGDLIWYYQTTLGDTWDYTATQHMILADLEINGRLLFGKGGQEHRPMTTCCSAWLGSSFQPFIPKISVDATAQPDYTRAHAPA
jgi:hypothetical protein